MATSSTTRQRTEGWLGRGIEAAKDTGWKITTLAAAGAIALSGCAEAKPTPTETAVEKTFEQYIEQFTELKDPAELQLAAGAKAEEFGPWITDLTQEWKFAGCSNPGDIIRAASTLTLGGDITDASTDFYPKIAEANADAPTIAMFGKNWPSNRIAVRWRDASIKVNTNGIGFCVIGKEDEAYREDYVSAIETGKDAEGNPIFDVTVNVVPGPHSDDRAGEKVYTYDTSVEDGSVVVDNIEINGNQF